MSCVLPDAALGSVLSPDKGDRLMVLLHRCWWRRKKASRTSDINLWDFPGVTVVKTLSFHCSAHGFDP